MKICVYAICKNEEKFIERWYESVKEADKIFVLDTGSTDESVSKLKKLGVTVKSEIISPWRFDVARNKSLQMVDEDTDVCVCMDLDEVFEKGWRKKLERIWQEDTTRASYTYNWSLDDKGKPLVSFYSDKIHTREGYKWTHPVHEVLSYDGEEKRVFDETIVVNHFPDRSKSRGSYLPLLELSVKEDPTDDRNMHYLGREYMYYERWNEAIDTLIRHLNLEKAVWKDERCASMRFIGRCYKHLKRPLEAVMWYEKALEEAPHLKEAYSELALFYYENGDYDKAIPLFLKTLKVNKNYKTYITEWFSTDFSVYDFLSICYFNLKQYDKALEYANKALEIEKDERVLQNKKIIMEKATIYSLK